MDTERLNRRDFLAAGTAGLAGLALSSNLWSASNEKVLRKPNIVFFFADDLGYGDLNCYGGDTISTPHIDALSQGGVRFTDFHVNAPVCLPSRRALLSGCYQQRIRVLERYIEDPSFGEILQQAGYKTGIFGKWHLGVGKTFNPLNHGFDEFIGFQAGNIDYISHRGVKEMTWQKGFEPLEEEGYVTHLITRHTIDFIKRHKDRPFLAYVPYNAPHFPYQAPGDPIERPGPGQKAGRPDRPLTETYRIMVEEMDKGVGEVMTTLRKLGLEENTLVVFGSDNGQPGPGSSGPLRNQKGTMFEGGIRVPFMAYWPGRIQGSWVCQETLMAMDWYPTLAAVAGASLPTKRTIDGIDLTKLLFEGRPIDERTLFWEEKGDKAVRQGPWKLVIPKEPLQDAKAAMLFNLDADLSEKHNLADQQPGKVKELLNTLQKWEKSVTPGT